MSFRFIPKLIIAYVKRFKVVIFVGILIGITIFLLMSFIIPFLFKYDVSKIGISGKYTLENLPDDILLKISRGLTKIDNENVVVPDLCSSWETTDNGKTWIFHLKKDLYWQDGKNLVSSDIHYDFSDVDLEYPDPQTIIFKLKENAFSPFPSTLIKPVFRQGLLGIGDWKVENITFKGGYISSLKIKNDTQKIIYKFYPTSERLKLAYKLGEIDEIDNLLEPDPFLHWSTSNVLSKVNKNQVVLIFINTADPLLSEKSIRQALAYAIKKDEFGERAYGPISPNSWAYNPQIKQYDYDIQRANELLDEYKNANNDSNVKYEIKLVSTPYLINNAESIAKSWNDIGINTTVQVSSVVPADFQAFLTILDIPKDPDQYPLWHSTRTTTNISKYTNLRIDKLLEDGRTIIDFEERRKVYLDFQRFLVEDLPAIFLYYPSYYSVVRK